MVIGTLLSGSIPLLAKVDRPSQTAFQQDSNTNLETFGDNSDMCYPEFGDNSDMCYPEFSLHLKHIGYLSPTIKPLYGVSEV